MKRFRTIELCWLGLLCLAVQGCDDETPTDECALTMNLLSALRVDSAQHPSPVVDGTVFQVRGEGFIAEAGCVTPQVALMDGGSEVILTSTVESTNDIVAVMPSGGVASLGGVGSFTGALEVRFIATSDGATYRAAIPLNFELNHNLTPAATGLMQSEAYLNDQITLAGSGFLDGAEEGTTEVVLDGLFETNEGELIDVSGVAVPATLVTDTDRSRVSFLWSPHIGSVHPGTFLGTITPRNAQANGSTITGSPIEIELDQQDTVIFGITPETVAIGEIADVNGRGFIGSAEDSGQDGGTTSFRLNGEFTPCTGGMGAPLNCNNDPMIIDGTVELIGNWVSGELVRYPLTIASDGGMLHATDFGSQRGTFEGSITPVLTLGTESHTGIPVPDITLTLGPVRQICWVIFLPGFSTSLDLFGLGAVESVVRQRIVDRMQEIYHPDDNERNWINVEFRTEEPEDFYPGGYAILEIGGPDPNNIGLFGYDNTPGKDIGNLRLWDHVGGRNALGELDGYGYGGVFVESMLFWSEHPPEILGDRPRGSPPPTPLFDSFFDPVREYEVVAGEYPDGASPERVAEIETAILFLANMVADTAAHEFGHSLGLAQPYIPDEAYHNAIPQSGCLMDSGRDRPLEERAMILGNEGAHFCQENLWYLQDILPIN